MRRRARRVLRRVPELRNSQFLSIDKPESILVDLRGSASFARGFIPGSYNLGGLASIDALRENVRPEQRTVYLIGKCEKPQDLVRDFAKHKFEIAGWFQPDVLRDWQTAGGALGTIEELDPEVLAVRIAAWKTIVIDLREPHAYRRAHIAEALNLSLKHFRASVAGLPQQSSVTVVCETGDRSSFGASLLWNMNYSNVAILRGGFQRYVEAGLPVVRG
jgi:rhodanese-related sulfurtransferase